MNKFPSYSTPSKRDIPSTVFDEAAFLESHRNPRRKLPASNMIHSAQELSEAGVHLHLGDFEIESKLGLSHISDTAQVCAQLKEALEERGYNFIESTSIIRDNYACYYLNDEGDKAKIVARNNGDNGYQLKLKSKATHKSSHVVRVKQETRGPVASNLHEAELGLPATMNPYPVLILHIIKHKLTLYTRGADGVTRYFRLSVDESSLPGNDKKKLYQLELEYKGSDKEAEDNLSRTRDEMEKIIKNIQKIKGIEVTPSTPSKYKWGMQNKDH